MVRWELFTESIFFSIHTSKINLHWSLALCQPIYVQVGHKIVKFIRTQSLTSCYFEYIKYEQKL